jgi:hydrophobe/amphiphile efflux-1 (HAE1) family protein
VAVTPQQGSNHIEIADEFFKRVEQIKKEAPQDLNYNVVVDSTISLRNAIDEVANTIILAFLLVVLVIFLFLREWRTTLIPILAIPISLIGSFFIMYIMGFSINILTLLGIVLATGLVVDDAIVMMENIYSKIEKGMKGMEAGHKGTEEIFFAIVSTTVTLCAVFLPIIFLQGLTGRLFREFGIVVAGSVIISTIVSLTLTPMMSARILKHSQKHNRFFVASEKFFIWLSDKYASSLASFMQMRWLALVIMTISIGLIISLGLLIPSELAPMEDKSRLTIFSTAPEGVSFELMDKYMKDVMRVLDSVPEKKTALTVTAPSFGSSTAVNSGFARVALVQPEERTKSQDDIANELTAKFRKLTFARTFVSQEQTIGSDRRGGLPIQYVIQAPNFEKLKEAIPAFMKKANEHPAFQVVDLNLKFNKPELSVDIDRDRARALGITVADISETLQLYFSGQRFGYFIMNGKQYQVIGQASRDNRDEPLDLSSINIRNNKGELIQLDNLVKLSDQSSPPQLFRYNRYVSATVSASPAPGTTLGQGIEAMDEVAAAVLDDTFSTTLSGAAKEFMESSNSLLFAFFLALALVFLALAAQFESFIDPLIIMLTVPLALAGAMLSLYLFGQTLNIFSQIGIIVLVGIVTKNGILIVEFANQKKEQGMKLVDAVIEASQQRFRPILMTSMATVLGAVPIAMSIGSSSKSRVPMGIVIIGGLLFSLALTLYVIPALYSYLSREVQGSKFKVQSSVAVSIILIFSIFQFSNLSAQQNEPVEKLTLEEAIQIGLQNNYNIILAKNDAAIAGNNNSLITTGFVPTVAANLQQNNSLYNTEQQFLDGRQQSGNNASSKAVMTGVQLNWTIFDGTKMFVTKNKLEEIENLGNIQTRATIENTVAAIQNTYFTIVQHEKYVKVIQEALQLSDERLKIANAKFSLGSASELTVLQTKVDMNADSANLLQNQSAIIKNKALLNELLARDVATPFTVDTFIQFAEQMNYDNLLTSIENDNPQLLSARVNKEIAALNIKELRTNYGPRVSLYGAYNYNWQKNEVGFLQTNRSFGPAYGLTASFNIFDGLQTRRNTQNAKIEMQSAQTNYEYSLNNVKSMLYRAYQDYVSNLQLAKLELSNIDVAKKNVVVALERYKLGNINDIELRETQLKLVDAQSRLLIAQYQTKLAEVELFRLTGKLSK